MSDEPRAPELPLGAALRALPLPVPPPGGWSRLVAQRRHRLRRRRIGLALAASLLAAIGVALLRPVADAPPPAAVTASVADPLPALRAESVRLEALLAWSGEAWVDTGDSAALDARLGERLQWVDLQLNDSRGYRDQQRLWSERVLLLRQRAQLAQARVLLADGEHGTASDVLLVL
jgi:hypothetical protein